MNRVRVGVAGAAGQTGTVIIRHLASLPNVETVAVCRNPVSAGLVHSSEPKCNIRIGSITEEKSAQKILGDCDVIVNCALAMVSGKPKLSRLLNRQMIDNFARLDSLKVLIHMSSVSVYGSCIVEEKLSSKSFERPPVDSDYGRSKLIIEKYAENICRSRRIQYYMLRLGHVIGAKMDRSRQILEFASDPRFRLPYDGELPSNTIHVERLAAMVAALIRGPLHSGTYNVADAGKTWRQVFNWHTDTIGLAAVKGMPRDRSDSLREHFASASVPRDVKKWLGSLPLLSLVKYPAIFNYALRVFANTPQQITSSLAVIYKRMDIRKQIADLAKNDDHRLGPVYVSDAMPGTYLEIPEALMTTYPAQRELDSALRNWHERFALPQWLPDQLIGDEVKVSTVERI